MLFWYIRSKWQASNAAAIGLIDKQRFGNNVCKSLLFTYASLDQYIGQCIGLRAPQGFLGTLIIA